ncbi:MAG: hypothetical protein PHC61_04775 [Chitinivibrionales bacterium]|nr:hypothetical protein [Chitinivibrionales bacterium]
MHSTVRHCRRAFVLWLLVDVLLAFSTAGASLYLLATMASK